jgi:hypothetical protein
MTDTQTLRPIYRSNLPTSTGSNKSRGADNYETATNLRTTQRYNFYFFIYPVLSLTFTKPLQ